MRINFWHICKDLQKERETGHKTACQCPSCARFDWQRSGSGSWVPGHCWRTGSKNQMSYGEKKFSLIYAWRRTHKHCCSPHISLPPFVLFFKIIILCLHTSSVMQQHSGNMLEVSAARFPAPAPSLFPTRSADHIIVSALNRVTGAPATKTECRAEHTHLPRDRTLPCTPNEEIQT